MRQDLATFERCQGCERFGIEARVFKTKTAIHRVGCKFERLLLDIVLDLGRERHNRIAESECDTLAVTLRLRAIGPS